MSTEKFASFPFDVEITNEESDLYCREYEQAGGFQNFCGIMRQHIADNVLTVTDLVYWKMVKYSNPKYGSGGWQNATRAILRRIHARLAFTPTRDTQSALFSTEGTAEHD